MKIKKKLKPHFDGEESVGKRLGEYSQEEINEVIKLIRIGKKVRQESEQASRRVSSGINTATLRPLKQRVSQYIKEVK